MASTAIVVVNASVVTAPEPDTLQQMGGLISQGATTLTAGTAQLVSQFSDITALLAPAKAITSLAWASSVVTVTTASPHGFTIGDVIPITIAGAVPTGYNGTFQGTVTGTSAITYPLVANPGTETTPGTIALGATSELIAMGTTYFAGNGVPAVYVVELGEGTPTEGVAELTTFLANVLGTDDQIYGFLVPREWDDNSAFIALANNNTSVSAEAYFWVTTTIANRAVYAGIKSVYAEVEAPTIPATEFSLASAFGTALKANPSSTNRVPPLGYAPSFGTTAYPIRGNQSVFSQLQTANVGWIGTGQQGGISGNILFQGRMSDGLAWNFWYSVDWMQIQSARNIANEVINGSASSVNPLYYNQQGINRLQNRVVQTAQTGIASGLGNGQVVSTQLPQQVFLDNYNKGVYAGQIVINAEPFLVYSEENPDDYGQGRYAGLSAIWIPLLGFQQVVFDLQATTLITGG